MSRKRLLLCIVLYVLLCSSLVVSVEASSRWFRQYFGIGICTAYSLVEASDGGYAIAGLTASFGAGYRDFWLVKTDAFGNMEWNKTYGGTDWEWAWSLVATSDGGYAIAGYTSSFGGFSGGGFWLVKTTKNGIMEWNKTYGTMSDEARSLVATSDGGYAITGARGPSFWLVKTDGFGDMQWNKTYSSAGRDMAQSLVETSDGGYAIAGYSESFDTDWSYFWFVKTDAAGNMQWNKTYGEGADEAWSLIETPDGGYALTGGSLLVKTNVFGNMEWNQTYTGTNAFSVVATSDGGYAITGAHGSICCLVKTDEFGVVPEYTSWLVPTLVLTTTAFIIINKKRLRPKR